MDLKHVVPDMEKTFGRLTFGGEGEAEVTRGRNSRPLSRTYNLFSDVQRARSLLHLSNLRAEAKSLA